MIFRARLNLASDIRKGHCNIEELDDRRTLKYFGITSGVVLHVAVAPAMSDLRRLRRSGPACIPPPRPPREVSHSADGMGAEGAGGGPGRRRRPRGVRWMPVGVG